ncbi:MAG: 3-hydroxyacyl-ACP dehydratase FabZ [Bacteroidales bacterium]|jgi:3-hydroxyacyl-[acyl-carrier-protein] dehydratase|nr:3-hydroxyacyl-ACP dehydratase FabZ [Bacteroidales bacterium]
MKREEIKNFLPHREPMLLVDEMEIDENGICHGKYTVRGDEFFLQGHFPGHPVVPGVILCEIMGQSSSILVMKEMEGCTPMFTGIDKTRFKGSVVPGDTVEVTAKVTAKRGPIFFIDAEAHVEGRLCVQATLSVALVKNDNLKV